MILIDRLSVVVRVSDVEDRYPGGWDALRELGTYSDGELAVLACGSLREAVDFHEHLQANGIATADCALVLPGGQLGACPWLEMGSCGLQGVRVKVARLVGSAEPRVTAPVSWLEARRSVN